MIKLGKVAENQYGYTAKALKNNSLPKMLRITDIQNGGVDWKNVPNCEIDDEQKEKYLLRDNDIVVARTGSVGKSYIVKNPVNSVFASYLIRIRVSKNISADYVYYFLQSDFYWKQIWELATGSVQLGVNSTKLQNIEIPVPPLAEQKRIVQRIDFLFEKLDTASNALKSILRRLELHKVYLLKDALDGALTAEYRANNGISKDDWQEKTLGEICKLIQGEKLSEKNFPYLEVKYLRGVKVAKIVDNGRFISVGTKIILVDGENSGEIFTAPEDGYLGSTFRALQIAENVDADFFQYFVSTKKDLYHSKKRGSAIPHLDKKLFNSTPINLPPLAEQKEIARQLDSFISKENFAQDSAEKILQQIDALKKNILARAFRGELGNNKFARI